MAVGTTAMTVYQGEDVSWEFTVNDPNIASIAGFDIELVVKETAAEPDPPLVGPITCTIVDTLKFRAVFNADLDPSSYVYSARRVDIGFSWQLAQAALTVLDSASIDITP